MPTSRGSAAASSIFTIKELEANIAYQIGALQAIAALHGAKVTHMKPHGMMANMSAESVEMSEAIARRTRAVDRDLIFLAQANTEQGKAARKHGLRVAEEVFADRTYTDAGFLTPRKEANSMIKDPAKAVEHVRRMVDEQAIYSTSGKRIPVQVDSDLRPWRRPDGGDRLQGGARRAGSGGDPHRAAAGDAQPAALNTGM